MLVLHKLLQDKNNLNQVTVIHLCNCGTLGSGWSPFKKALVATMRRAFGSIRSQSHFGWTGLSKLFCRTKNGLFKLNLNGLNLVLCTIGYVIFLSLDNAFLFACFPFCSKHWQPGLGLLLLINLGVCIFRTKWTTIKWPLMPCRVAMNLSITYRQHCKCYLKDQLGAFIEWPLVLDYYPHPLNVDADPVVLKNFM